MPFCENVRPTSTTRIKQWLSEKKTVLYREDVAAPNEQELDHKEDLGLGTFWGFGLGSLK